MACTAIQCAKCCTVFSMAGLIFLLIIGHLLRTQPLYIHGATEPGKESAACYQGAAIYAATLVLSITYWAYDESKKRVLRALESSRTSNAGETSANTSAKIRTRGTSQGKYGAVSLNDSL